MSLRFAFSSGTVLRFGVRPHISCRFARQPLGPVSLYAQRARRKSSNDGAQQAEPQTSAIRPLTVFALCIPLGYALKWAFGDDKSLGGRTSSSDGFVKYTLIAKEDVSSTNAIFTLKPATGSSGLESARSSQHQPQQVTSVEIKQPQLQIARSYTLLPSRSTQDDGALRLLIRKEQRGEVSGYIHRLTLGAELEIRGPCAEYVLPENVDTVMFLAGGTGIAPALQVAESIGHGTYMRILWANRKREDCLGGESDNVTKAGWSWFSWSNHEQQASTGQLGLLVEMLDEQKNALADIGSADAGSQLQVDYFVDEEGTFLQPKEVAKALRMTHSPTPPQTSDGSHTRLLFVSGPPGFVSYWAGPKTWADGRETQGSLGGVLGTLDLKDWKVVKM